MITTLSLRKPLRFAQYLIVFIILAIIGVIFNITSPIADVEASLVVVSNFNVASANAYEIVKDGFVPGAVIYTDRCFDSDNCFRYNESIPPSLIGVTYIKTANDDKAATDDVFMTFDVDRDVTIYVAFDERARAIPLWLSEPARGWADTGESVTVHDASLNLFSKEFLAGSTVELGANNAEGTDFRPGGSFSNYTVMIEEPPILLVGEETISAGEETSISVTLDRVPEGLSGYDIVANLANPLVGDFIGAEFVAFDPPEGFKIVEISEDGSQIRFAAVDVPPGVVQSGDTNILLANLIVRGVQEGVTSIDMTVDMLDSDSPPLFPRIEALIVSGNITVLNGPPQVIVGPDVTIGEGETLSKSITIDDPGDNAWTVTVDYGDGADSETFEGAGTEVALDHVYADDGNYTVTVTAADEADTGTNSFIVAVENSAPTVTAGADQTGLEGGIVSINSAAFNDLGTQDTHSAVINWGDGIFDIIPFGDADIIETPFGPPGDTFGMNGTVVVGNHVYADNGTYTVTVTVTDDDGGSGSDTSTVTIGNVSPTLEAMPNRAARVGDTVELGLVKFNDLGTLDTHSAVIDWGDDTFVTGIVTESPTGPPGNVAGASGTVRGSHVYTSVGTFTVEIALSDDDGAPVSGSFEVEISGLQTRIEFKFQGSARPRPEGWEKSITVTLSRVGEEIIIPATTTFDPVNEVAFIDIPDLQIGNYDISVVSESTLTSTRRNVALTESSTVDMGVLVSGDVNGDGVINSFDFSILLLTFFKSSTQEGFDPRADLDMNGIVNSFDFSILISNFGKFSPIEVIE